VGFLCGVVENFLLGCVRFIAGCFSTFRRNVSSFSSGFQGPWRMTYTVNSKLAVDLAWPPDNGCRLPKHVGLTIKSVFITDQFYSVAKMYRYWIVIAWFLGWIVKYLKRWWKVINAKVVYTNLSYISVAWKQY